MQLRGLLIAIGLAGVAGTLIAPMLGQGAPGQTVLFAQFAFLTALLPFFAGLSLRVLAPYRVGPKTLMAVTALALAAGFLFVWQLRHGG
ncbi:MAG: hypothetical protein AAF788_03585 [Pseudomonadota bacterium]